MLYETEYQALTRIKDNPDSKEISDWIDSGIRDHLRHRRLTTEHFFSKPSPYYGIRITAIGMEALSEYDKRQEELKEEKYRLKRKSRTDVFFRVLTVFTFFITVLANWNTISAFFVSAFSRFVSLFHP